MEDRINSCTSSFLVPTPPSTITNPLPNQASVYVLLSVTSLANRGVNVYVVSCTPHISVFSRLIAVPHFGAYFFLYEAFGHTICFSSLSQVLSASDFFLMAWFSGVAVIGGDFLLSLCTSNFGVLYIY